MPQTLIKGDILTCQSSAVILCNLTYSPGFLGDLAIVSVIIYTLLWQVKLSTVKIVHSVQSVHIDHLDIRNKTSIARQYRKKWTQNLTCACNMRNTTLETESKDSTTYGNLSSQQPLCQWFTTFTTLILSLDHSMMVKLGLWMSSHNLQQQTLKNSTFILAS